MLQNLTKVVLHGDLADRYGKEHYCLLTCTKDAIDYLCTNYPDFKEYLADKNTQYQLVLNDKVVEELDKAVVSGSLSGSEYSKSTSTGTERLQLKPSPSNSYSHFTPNELHLVPVVEGSGAIGKVFLGVALIAAAVAIPFAAVGGGTSLGLLGGSLVLSGITEALTPKTITKETQEQQIQNSTINLQNPVTSRDTPIPLAYGALRIDVTTILSAGTTTDTRSNSTF